MANQSHKEAMRESTIEQLSLPLEETGLTREESLANDLLDWGKRHNYPKLEFFVPQGRYEGRFGVAEVPSWAIPEGYEHAKFVESFCPSEGRACLTTRRVNARVRETFWDAAQGSLLSVWTIVRLQFVRKNIVLCGVLPLQYWARCSG